MPDYSQSRIPKPGKKPKKASKGLKRKKPLESKSKLKRGELPKYNKKRRAKTKAKCFGEQAATCRTLHCGVCGRPPPSDPHHYPAMQYGGVGADDTKTLPLCRWCHTECETLGQVTFWARKKIDPLDLIASVQVYMAAKAAGEAL